MPVFFRVRVVLLFIGRRFSFVVPYLGSLESCRCLAMHVHGSFVISKHEGVLVLRLLLFEVYIGVTYLLKP